MLWVADGSELRQRHAGQTLTWSWSLTVDPRKRGASPRSGGWSGSSLDWRLQVRGIGQQGKARQGGCRRGMCRRSNYGKQEVRVREALDASWTLSA